MGKTIGILFLTVLALTSSLIATTTPQAQAYKQSIDVPLSNGHHVTVHFADNFPDQLLATHADYMRTYIPQIAELFYMPDHDFTITYNTEPPPNGCGESGASGGLGAICIRTDILEGEDVAEIIAHELTHVFQAEITAPGFPGLLLEGSAVAVAMILTHGPGFGQVISGDVDYTAITPENGLGVYLNGRGAPQSYILGNGLEKLYAYKPTYLREWTSQLGALQSRDSYNAIFGEAVLDSKPLSRWLYEQGLGTWGPTDSSIYAETYAALFTGKFFARAEVWQWTADGRITKVAPETATCRIYRLNGEYITERQAEILQGSWPSAYWGAIEDPNITYDTEAEE